MAPVASPAAEPIVLSSCPRECFALLRGLVARYLRTSILPASSLLPVRPAFSRLIKPAPLGRVLIPPFLPLHPSSNPARNDSLGTGLFLFPSPLMSRLASPHPSLNTAFEVTAFPALSPPAPRRSSRSRWSLEMLFMKPAFHPLPPRGPFPPTGHFLSLGAPAALLAFSTRQHLLPASPGLSDTYASMLPSSHSAAVLGALLGDALAGSVLGSDFLSKRS